MPATLEQRILTLSIAATLVVSALGVSLGLISGSEAILFDGVFSSIDAAMSMLALAVTRLVMRESTRRFQLGYWHLEPMAAAFNGAVLVLLCFYAFLNALGTWLKGGSEPQLGLALGYAVAVSLICFTLFFCERQLNRRARSEFVRIDLQNWLMAGLITSALLIAFLLAWAMEGTRYAGWIPYVDTTLVMLLTLVFVPIPLRIVYRAMREVLMVAPSRLDSEVRAAMAPVMRREGLLAFDSYVAKSGRVYTIEVHILTTPEFARDGGIAVCDEIRAEIAAGLSMPAEQRWFTVAFTADQRWL
ncbi:cation transporter [Salinicola sp. RZ23]|uniref:cation diffusion facilitator family transporter n=1 Tax=Salinicola sp. RZ23 TaxID=1949087 RepID=UPI000DA10CFD|nr:cation transporter [Salinicola sp. RZ23]